MFNFICNPDSKAFIFEQIRDEFIKNIENGNLKKNCWLPTINEFSEQYGLSKTTVGRAYMHLKYKGYISYIHSKGYYVIKESLNPSKILFIVDEFNYSSQLIYKGLIKILNRRAAVNLQIYHDDLNNFHETIEDNLNRYSHFILLSQSRETHPQDYLKILQKIPSSRLILLGKSIPGLERKYRAIFHDWESNLLSALESVSDVLTKYMRLIVVTPSPGRVMGVINGVKRFCTINTKEFLLFSDLNQATLIPDSLYIVLTDNVLASLIKKSKRQNFELGKDIGIISTSENELKELLGITVFTFDFTNMGQMAATMIVNEDFKLAKETFQIIRRKSL